MTEQVKNKEPKKVTHTTIKIPVDAYTRAQELLKVVSGSGWHVLGIDRNDPPTLGAVIAESIKLIEAQWMAKAKGSPK